MWRTRLKANAMEHEGANSRNATIMPPESQTGIVHDLGNLIQIASSALNIIGRNPDNQIADLDGVIIRAKISLDRAGAIVRQALVSGRERFAGIRPVNLATCLAELEALLQDTWERGIELEVQPGSELIFVRCDPLALQNAIVNLLLNARDAMPGGGHISVDVAPVLMGLGDSGVDSALVAVQK